MQSSKKVHPFYDISRRFFATWILPNPQFLALQQRNRRLKNKKKKEVAFKISAAFKCLFELDFLGIDDLAHFATQVGGYKP